MEWVNKWIWMKRWMSQLLLICRPSWFNLVLRWTIKFCHSLFQNYLRIRPFSVQWIRKYATYLQPCFLYNWNDFKSVSFSYQIVTQTLHTSLTQNLMTQILMTQILMTQILVQHFHLAVKDRKLDSWKVCIAICEVLYSFVGLQTSLSLIVKLTPTIE